uniref:Uncharacterized protein n=1 Tax=Sinocyclocheilus grahami TaxID=75366 RepID=A0A672PBV9_SINGR
MRMKRTRLIKAARIIQRAWRDTAVFKHLKKLVSLHNQGDPRLLRFINPAEANILDSASGALIRFRLGGVSPTYPPNIYFKIYTRAPIVDMCASSLKDYTQLKKPAPSQIHNGRMMINDGNDHSGWYQRVENNGWRILSYPNIKKIEFHHCGEIYVNDSIIVSTGIMMDSLEQIGTDSVSEQEVDELLAWTKALNFDEYINEWRDLGTSKCCIVNNGKTHSCSLI